jgi:outer membrane protein assembly factor BamB
LVLVCGNDSALYGFDARNLEKQWAIELPGQALYGAPTSFEKRVWFAGCGTRRGTVCCVDIADGRLVWRRELPIDGDIVRRTLSHANGSVFVPAGYHGEVVYALDGASGEVVWRRSLGTGSGFARPLLNAGNYAAVAQGRLIIPSLDGHCRCLKAANGEVLWDVDLGVALESSPAVHGETVVLGTNAGEVVRLRIEDGAIGERTPVGGAIVASPALHGSSIVCATIDGWMASLEIVGQ